MRYSDSILGNLLKPISRRWFDGLVDRHAGNAYDKKFGSWDHLVALVYAQLGGIESLRALEERQRPSPLPSRGWPAGALDAGRCQRPTAAGDLR